MKQHLPLFEAVSVIVGTIIGAGIVGIPFVFVRGGFLTGVVVLVLVSIALTLTRLMLGEVVMRTEQDHQLTGYTQHYLGRAAKHIQGSVLIVGIFGTLLAYMVGQGEVLSALLGGSEVAWSLGAYLVFSFLVLMGIDTIKRLEFAMISLLFFVVLTIATFSITSIQPAYYSAFDKGGFLIPFGVVLFASAGLVAVPQSWRVLKDAGKGLLFKKAIIWGGVIPFLLYLVFALLVVGVTGDETTQVATIGLGEALGPHMIIIGNVFAFFAITSSFLTLAMAQGNIFHFDYGVSRVFAVSIVIVVPLIMFTFGLRDFISIISVVGSYTVGINGLLAIILYWKAKRAGDRKPEYSIPPSLAIPASVFLAGIFLLGLIAVVVVV